MPPEEEFEEFAKTDAARLELHPLQRDRFFPPAEVVSEVASAPSQEYGPCLYLGPKGQRCNRPATEGGYCGVHREGGIARAVRDPRRILAAAITLIVILWPYLHDALVEILRWINSR